MQWSFTEQKSKNTSTFKIARDGKPVTLLFSGVHSGRDDVNYWYSADKRSGEKVECTIDVSAFCPKTICEPESKAITETLESAQRECDAVIEAFTQWRTADLPEADREGHFEKHPIDSFVRSVEPDMVPVATVTVPAERIPRDIEKRVVKAIMKCNGKKWTPKRGELASQLIGKYHVCKVIGDVEIYTDTNGCYHLKLTALGMGLTSVDSQTEASKLRQQADILAAI